MKPRIAILALLVGLLLVVGLAPAAAQPAALEGLNLPETRGQTDAYPPAALYERQNSAHLTLPPSLRAGPRLPITAGPERIPATVLPDDSAESIQPSVSADGRYVAFGSKAENLVPGDQDGQSDVFVYDRTTHQTELITATPGVSPYVPVFYTPSISDDGRFVAFYGIANDLVPGEQNHMYDVYVLDRDDGSVARLSDAHDGSEANGNSAEPVLSPDGGFVAFQSNASNLVGDDTNGQVDIFLHDIAAGTTVRVSVSSSEDEANGWSYPGGISLNGQFVSFYSFATNLVPDDTNEMPDVFVRDVVNGTTERVSIGDGLPGIEGNGSSYRSDISANGRYVVFESEADNLIASDTNWSADVFVRDRQTNTTFRVSLDENGNPATVYAGDPSISGDGLTVAFVTPAVMAADDGDDQVDVYVRNWETGAVERASVAASGDGPDNTSYDPALSADASAVAFASYAGNLVPGDENLAQDVFLRELVGGPTTLVSGDAFDLTQLMQPLRGLALSANGRYVVFDSEASNLVPGDSNDELDVYLYDRQSSVTTLLVTSLSGGFPMYGAGDPDIDDTGNSVVFGSSSPDLIEGDTSGESGIFVYDRGAGSMTRVSVDSVGNPVGGEYGAVAISGDGTVVTFYSEASNLVPDDTNNAIDIFVHDMKTGETSRVSVSSAGVEAEIGSYDPVISRDGRYIAFESYAGNLVDNDHNGDNDVFVHDRNTGQTTLVSVAVSGEASEFESNHASISADGRYIAFASASNELVVEDEDWEWDVFVRDMSAGVTEKITHAFDGGPASSMSWYPDISADGRFVVFDSWAADLVPDDTNHTEDAFVYDRLTGETGRLSVSAGGDEGNHESYDPIISADGSTIAFASFASNIVPNDTNGIMDYFVVEQDTSEPVLHSVSGTIFHWEGYPLEGVTLSSLSVAGTTAVSNANGEYELWLPTGTHEVVATLENYQFLPASRIVILGPDHTGIDFTAYYGGWMTSWYEAIDDAYVDQSKKTTNFGSASFLRVKNASADMNIYLKFGIDTLDPLPGTCRTYLGTFLRTWVKEPSVDGGSVYAVDNGWTENTINWNNAPPIGGLVMGKIDAATDESDVITSLGSYVDGNGDYSLAVRNSSTNSADYRSWESGWGPEIGITFRQEIIQAPTAAMAVSHGWGLAPFTVQFTDYSEGCPTSWHWEFGDGNTSSERNPIHTFNEVGNYTVTLTVTNGEGSDSETELIRAQALPTVYYISTATNANLGGFTVQPADIVRYDKAANQWAMVYDGSEHGTLKNIGSFAFEGNNLLLVFSANQVIPGLGTATSRDIVRFTPEDPNVFPLGAGTYSWYRRGNGLGVGLTTSAETIDALDQQAWSDYISTTGAAALPTTPVLKAADEDVMEWYNWAGSWAGGLAVDGSVITGMAAEDINGLWYDDSGDYYVTMPGSFNLGGVAGTGKNIVRLHQNLNGTWTPSLVPWPAPGATFTSTIDAIELAR